MDLKAQDRTGEEHLNIIKVIKDGIRKSEKKWIATGLTDTPENVRKASEARMRMINKKGVISLDLNITLADYIEHFLGKKSREIKDTTYSGYYYRGKRITDYFGDSRVRDINEKTVENFLDDLLVVHHLQPRTVKDIKVVFGKVMDQAVKDGIVTYNPVKEVKINKNLADKYARDKKDDDFFSYEEAQLFLNRVRDHGLYELFYLTLFFGLRREEILGLKWSAIDFKNKTMIINHTVTKGMTITRANTTKTTSSSREYPLTDEQIAMFLQMKDKEKVHRQLCGNEYVENDYVFKHIDGSLYYPDYPTKAFKKLIRKIPELPQDITFHGLRISCVSILVHQGMDIKSIQKWVGHADIDTTLRIYARVKDKEAKKEISERMKDIIHIKDYED